MKSIELKLSDKIKTMSNQKNSVKILFDKKCNLYKINLN